MSHDEARLANATAVEMYARAMRTKGLHTRADWAFAEAKKIRERAEASKAAALALTA